MTSKRSKYALYLRGFRRAPITDILLEDCAFDNVARPNVVENVRDLTMRHVRINGEVVDKV